MLPRKHRAEATKPAHVAKSMTLPFKTSRNYDPWPMKGGGPQWRGALRGEANGDVVPVVVVDG